jgi:2-polyprenyl-6-hydroxyphenyl methylase/3-demethylubiquinone-9 3-methyltransferase
LGKYQKLVMENCTLTSIELFKQLDKTLFGFSDWTTCEVRYINEIIRHDARLLDVGCGWGREVKGIAPLCDTVIGIDIDAIELKQAKNYLGQLPNVILSQQDARFTAFHDNEFDVVVSVGNTFGNLEDAKENVLSEMLRIVKQDGWIFLSVFAKQSTRERATAYSNIGLEITNVRDGKIYFSDGYMSEGFQEDELERLFSEFDLECEFVKIGYIGLFAILRREKLFKGSRLP